MITDLAILLFLLLLKFDVIHQTISRRDVRMGWARD